MPTDLTGLGKNNDVHFPCLKPRKVIDGSTNANVIRAHGRRESPALGDVFRVEAGMVYGHEGGSYTLAKARIRKVVHYRVFPPGK